MAIGWFLAAVAGLTGSHSGSRRSFFNFAAPYKGGWLPFLDTYRTMCLAPQPEFRHLLEGVREERWPTPAVSAGPVPAFR